MSNVLNQVSVETSFEYVPTIACNSRKVSMREPPKASVEINAAIVHEKMIRGALVEDSDIIGEDSHEQSRSIEVKEITNEDYNIASMNS